MTDEQAAFYIRKHIEVLENKIGYYPAFNRMVEKFSCTFTKEGIKNIYLYGRPQRTFYRG